jgi:hypothetical protein
MDEKIKPLTAWMITNSDRHGAWITFATIHFTRTAAIKEFVSNNDHKYTWEQLREMGYGVVKVKITPQGK